jgi:tetratricopeptide (TPR) repeat protein
MTTAQQLKESGMEHFRAERLDEAAGAFAAAAELFSAQGQPAQAAEMHNNLAVVRLGQQDWDGALTAAQGTPDVFRAAGDRLREAQAISNLAAANEGLGRLDEAAALFEQAIDIYRELGERENQAACWKALSGLQVKKNDRLQALASMQAGLNLTPKPSPREKMLKGLINRAFKMMGPR